MVSLTTLFAEAKGLELTARALLFLLPRKACELQLEQVSAVNAALPGLSLVQRFFELHAGWMTLEFAFGYGGKATFPSSMKCGNTQSPAAKGDGDRP